MLAGWLACLLAGLLAWSLRSRCLLAHKQTRENELRLVSMHTQNHQQQRTALQKILQKHTQTASSRKGKSVTICAQTTTRTTSKKPFSCRCGRFVECLRTCRLAQRVFGQVTAQCCLSWTWHGGTTALPFDKDIGAHLKQHQLRHR